MPTSQLGEAGWHASRYNVEADLPGTDKTVIVYGQVDLQAMVDVWNEVVRDGISFPQEDEVVGDRIS